MYNPLLDTFIAVADCGSLTKASERLYISSTAVMKQINALEARLDLKLIDRTHSGIRLTRAGDIIYRDAKFMMDYSKKSIAEAKKPCRTMTPPFASGPRCSIRQSLLWIYGIG